MAAGEKELRRRITSVKNTRKITYAMKLVSAAKLRRTQEAVQRSSEYMRSLAALLADITADLTPDQSLLHPLMTRRSSVSRIALVVIGGGRGLCGSYNTNVNRAIESFLKARTGVDVALFVLGKKPLEYLRRRQIPVTKGYEELSDDPASWPLAELGRELEARFIDGTFDEVHLLSTKFKSAISMKATVDQLLPFVSQPRESQGASGAGDSLMEPSPKALFEALIPRLFRGLIRQAALDAKASEHGARMVAMDNATRNAGDLSKRLTLTYNKLRQASITAQILDIVGGAEAAQSS